MITTYHRTLRDDKLEKVNSVKRGSWIRVIDPDPHELKKLEKDFNLDKDLLEDGIDLYEAPRLERDDGNLYIYARYCRPEGEYTSTHPILFILTADNVITISRTESEPLEALVKRGTVVTTQKVKLVLEMLGEINRGYRTHLNDVTKRILATRNKLQRTAISNTDVIGFIDIEEDLNEYLAALQPYGIVLHALLNGKYIKMHESDEDLIEDLQLSASELIELTKSRLKNIQNIREAYSAIATNNLNQIFKRLTSIAIFMSIPTIVGGLYGMNVALPFDHHPQAFWIVFGITIFLMVGFIIYFKRKRWL
ncbi:magnesium transporter CorA family protein [Candidatus Saccharibacteria bacterium]|nr:magnesium transporter CorA family protein [Candidatus Saccharibacteria bacterium]